MGAVRLMPHDPRWPASAESEAERLLAACGPAMHAVHHIGSTANRHLIAKPVIDLLGVVGTLAGVDAAAGRLAALGYIARGENGFVGRRYFTLSDAATGARHVQLHCFADGDPAIARHLAFRDRLRAWPAFAAEYQREKLCCAALHPGDRRAYSACKAAWFAGIEASRSPDGSSDAARR